MLTRHPKDDPTPLINFCFRLTPAMKAAIHRRAAERSKREGISINPGQIVREILATALASDLEQAHPTTEHKLFDELLVAAFFARKSLAVLLRNHEGLARDLLEQSRAELVKRKRGGP